MKYFDALKQSMDMVAKEPNSIFLGQAVECAGTAMTNTLKDVPPEKKLEIPVIEETQLGMSTGLALTGFLPVSIFPRWNFLLLATNQLVNHLDKIPIISDYRPGVIIRVGVGSEKPLHPNYQHVGNFAQAFRCMFRTINVYECREVEEVIEYYQEALERAKEGKSSVLVEWGDYYNSK